MNPNTATNEQLRDWLAARQGWRPDPHSKLWVLKYLTDQTRIGT